jgi:hypothetical protein
VSRQRRHGQPVTIYRTEQIVDSRGNSVVRMTKDNPWQLTAAAIPQRSSRAEIPGQQEIDVIRLITTADLTDVNLWSRVLYRGSEWDIVSPPAYHHGTRLTRHWSVDIRRRP